MLDGNLGSLLYGDVSVMFKSERVFNIRIIASKQPVEQIKCIFGDTEIGTISPINP